MASELRTRFNSPGHWYDSPSGLRWNTQDEAHTPASMHAAQRGIASKSTCEAYELANDWSAAWWQRYKEPSYSSFSSCSSLLSSPQRRSSSARCNHSFTACQQQTALFFSFGCISPSESTSPDTRQACVPEKPPFKQLPRPRLPNRLQKAHRDLNIYITITVSTSLIPNGSRPEHPGLCLRIGGIRRHPLDRRRRRMESSKRDVQSERNMTSLS